jgi:hypothetical protein
MVEPSGFSFQYHVDGKVDVRAGVHGKLLGGAWVRIGPVSHSVALHVDAVAALEIAKACLEVHRLLVEEIYPPSKEAVDGEAEQYEPTF